MPSSAVSLPAPRSSVFSQRRLLFFLVIFLAIARLAWLQWQISHADYQGDFTAYWVAGQAALHGASPYTYQPHSASGAPFYYTSFLYPPLVASLLAPLGLVDFYHAKLIWSALQLVFLGVALGMVALLVRPRDPLPMLTALLAAAAVFPPVMLEFERGQIDCLTFLLVVGAIWAWTLRRNSVLAAVLLVAAGLFKLPTLLLLLIPLAFMDRKFITTAVATMAVMAVLSFALNGPQLTGRYWFHYLPSLAGVTHGDDIGSNPPPAPPPIPGALPSSQGGPMQWPLATWEGHAYVEKSTFPTRGSFASSYMSPFPEKLRKLVSGGGYLLSVVVIFLVAQAARKRPEQEQPLIKQALLAFAMVTVLVCHPLSWLMNYVWLLYISPILLLVTQEWRSPRLIFSGILVGTLLCFTWFAPHVVGIWYKALNQRFCLGSLLVYVAGAVLLLWWRQQSVDMDMV